MKAKYQYLILGAVSIVILLMAGCYVSQGALETFLALTGTVEDIFFTSSDAAVKPEGPIDTSSAGSNVMATRLGNDLMELDGATPQSLDAARFAGVKYWALYFSAGSNQACATFDPELVAFYNIFKPAHPNFDLVYINNDAKESDMFNSMRNVGMAWPAVWFADINNSELELKKYDASGTLPCLVLVDSTGRVLSTNESPSGRDPHEVLADIRVLVK